MVDEIEVSELEPSGELVARVAALDIAKASAMLCTRVPGTGVRKRQEIRKAGATTAAILELADHLVCQGIELVAMESTSDYSRVPSPTCSRTGGWSAGWSTPGM